MTYGTLLLIWLIVAVVGGIIYGVLHQIRGVEEEWLGVIVFWPVALALLIVGGCLYLPIAIGKFIGNIIEARLEKNKKDTW